MILFSTGSALLDSITFTLLVAAIIWIIIYVVLFVIACIFFKNAFISPKTFNRGKKSSKWLKYKDTIEDNWKEIESLEKEDVFLVGYKKRKIHATFIKSKTKSKKVILFSHGWKNQGLNDYACAGMFYHRLGYNVLVVDHFAHGKSEGKIISFSSYDIHNVKIWINYINELFNNDCEIIMHGLSMGATIVTRLANCELLNVKGIIADSGFNDAYEIVSYFARRDIKFLPSLVAFNMRIICLIVGGYDLKKCQTKSALIASRYPILFMHGDKDDFVPTIHTIKSYELCTSKKEVVIFDNAVHIVSCLMYPKKYQEHIIDFIERL